MLSRCNNSIILLIKYKPILSGKKKKQISVGLFQSEGIKVANAIPGVCYSEGFPEFLYMDWVLPSPLLQKSLKETNCCFHFSLQSEALTVGVVEALPSKCV